MPHSLRAPPMTGNALDTGGATANGTVMENWTSGGSYNQQWKFVK